MANPIKLDYTVEEINHRLGLIDENKNLLSYPYTTDLIGGLLPEGLTDVGDGSILISGVISVQRFLLTTCPLHPGEKYTISLDVTDVITEKPIDNSNVSLEVAIEGKESITTTSSAIIDLSAETGSIAVIAKVYLNISDYANKNVLIKPQIEEGEEKTKWVPNMDKIGTYVDRRFNNTNTKIKVLADSLSTMTPGAGGSVDLPLSRGEGENSLVQSGTTARALTENSIAFGDSTAGCKGYYFTEIYFGSSTEKGQLRLSATQPTDTGFLMSQKALDPLSTFETPSYILDSERENDRKIYIICGDHYFFCATIESITNDIVTFTTNLLDVKTKFENYNANNADKQYSTIENGYFKLRTEEIILPDGTVSPVVVDVDDYTITVPAQPTVGVVVGVGEVGTTFGYKTKATGFASLAEGILTIAAVSYAHAEGRETVAGYAAHSEGQETEAIGHRSHAEGFHTIASGMGAHAEGSRALVNNEIIKVIASGMGAHAEGSGTHATEPAAHAEGSVTEATAVAAHAEGKFTHATALAAHAEGIETTASEEAAHVEGYLCKASNKYSHAEGISCTASGIASHAEGNNNTASEDYSHAEGSTNKAEGKFSHAEGYLCTASKQSAHAEGQNTTASGVAAHAEGNNNTASGDYSHVEGSTNTAGGRFSHAEGYNCTTSKNYAHAEGSNCTASGMSSHAEGNKATASGDYSHAGGLGTQATAVGQTVIGKYNKVNSSNNVLFIIGNGASDTDRSNAFEIISTKTTGVSMKLGSAELTEAKLSEITSKDFSSMPKVDTDGNALISTKEYVAMYIGGKWVAVEASIYNGEVV